MEHWTSSIPSARCSRVHGSLPNQSTCDFLDLEKAFDCVPRGILWAVLQEYGVGGPLLRAVRSLCDRSRSLIRIVGSKSDLFLVYVGLWKGCPLSLVLFIIFMDRISRHSQRPEVVWSGVTRSHLEREIDRQIGAAATIIWSLYQSVVVKKELSQKAKLSIYWSIYVPTLPYGHDL